MNQFLDALSNDPTVTTIGLATLGAAVGLWLAATWWTYADMARRTTVELGRLAAAGWILASTPVLLPLSLATYLLVRPQATVAERRAGRLFEALAPDLESGRCVACGETVDPGWRRCPACSTWLASACDGCGQWSSAGLDVCPWCARDKRPRGGLAAAARRRVAVPILPDALPAARTGAAPAAIPTPDPIPVFAPEDPEDTQAWIPEPASGEVRPAAAFVGHRMGPLLRPANRGARDPRRVRDADRVAGSGRPGLG